MATTQILRGIDQVKGPYNGPNPLHVFRVSVNVNGSYTNAARPNFDLAAALQNSHEGITSVSIASVVCFGDYNDGTNTYTAGNAAIALTSTGASTNNVVTFQIQSGAVNGATGTEIANATSVNGDIGFLVVGTLTSGSLGAV